MDKDNIDKLPQKCSSQREGRNHHPRAMNSNTTEREQYLHHERTETIFSQIPQTTQADQHVQE